ncbi:unnamed protein product [Symbiodinium sp. KB8]|nr:unnamed protein product [Symbiodinium sp. KB8]
MAIRLGLPNEVPVPTGPFDENDFLDKSPTKRPRGGTGVKMPAGGTPVTLEAIQGLLAQQSATLLEAQRVTISELESRQNTRFQGIEKSIVEQKHVSADLKTYIQDLEDRVAKVEQSTKNGVVTVQRAEAKKLTLVFGGWGQQTRRHIILHRLKMAVEALKLQQLFDTPPFTTGPRRSVALCNFQQRPTEEIHHTRSRMLEVITSINAANAQLDGGDKPLWCSFSRTPQERGKAALPGFVKRVVLTHSPQKRDDLDLEYYSGKSWMDESQLSGLGDAPISPGVAKVDTRAGPGWIDVAGLAAKTGVQQEELQKMVNEQKFCELPKALGEATECKFRNDDIVILQEMPRNIELIPHGDSQVDTPTSQPRQQERQGRLIDFLAGARVTTRAVRVHVGSHKVLGTDHELIATELLLGRLKGRRRPETKPRVLTKKLPTIVEVDQHELERLAKEYTKVKGGEGYKDPPSVKALFEMARFSRLAEDWKRAFAERRREKKAHQERQVQRVAEGDWSGYRKLKMKKGGDWECHFAESQEGDPHKSIHDHLESIYGSTPPTLNDFEPEGVFQPILPEELQEAVKQGKRGKSVGEDGTSLELIDGVLQAEGGESALLNWFNEMLESACLPDDWFSALMIILPKTARPDTPKQLRPICMSSSVSKIFCRILLNRAKPQMKPIGSTQCSGPGKQPIDYIHTIHKLFCLEREWKFGLAFLKVDLEKAFDCVSKEALMAYVKSKIGKSHEARCWQRLLGKSEAHLHTAWGDSTLRLHHGIRQGAIESPLLFTNLAEWTLEETATRYAWPREDPHLKGLRLTELMFVDDATLWQTSLPSLAKRVEQWMVVLREAGLRINLGKCQLYVSPHNKEGGKLVVGGTQLKSDSHLNIMGIRFVVNQTTCELISPLLARARDKFWGGFHLLGSKATLHGRLRMLERVCGGAGLWCIAAFYPEKTALQAVNSFQLQLVVHMMKLKRGEGMAAGGAKSNETHKVDLGESKHNFETSGKAGAKGGSSAFVTIALLNDFIHTWAQVPEAAVPGENEEYCSHGSNIEPHNVQELTSTSSTSFQANHQHEGGNVLPDDSAPRSSEQLPLSEQPPENWMQMKEDAVFSNCCSDNLYKCEKQHLQESWLGSSGFVLNDLAKTNLRKEDIKKRQPPTDMTVEGEQGQDMTTKKRKGNPDGDGNLHDEDQDDFSSLVATKDDRGSSRTPRRTTARRPTVTEGTVWLTPAGALHQPPPQSSEAASSTGPTTTDEAINMWHELLGFVEPPTDSLPTVIPEHMQEAIQRAVRSMPPRSLGILRRSLPLSLNAVQEEVMELLRLEASRRDNTRCASEGAVGAGRRNENAEVEDEGDDMVRVEVEESEGAESDRKLLRPDADKLKRGIIFVGIKQLDELFLGRRQSWWDTAAEEVLGASPDGKVNLAVWEGVARTIQLRQSENYSKFANNLMNFIGGEPRMENEEETDETGMMQRTLTKLLGQQSRSRIVLQGLNFRLSNLQGDEAARRARALLVRLTHRFAIAANSRDRQPELVQDAEAILAGHADPELCRGHFGTDADVEFVEAWWKDLIGALNHDLNAGPQPALHCMSHREVQEIERGQESDNENEIARQQWEEYMAEKENAEKLDHQRDDGHETGGEAGPRTAEPECTTGNPSGRAYQQWEDGKWASDVFELNYVVLITGMERDPGAAGVPQD